MTVFSFSASGLFPPPSLKREHPPKSGGWGGGFWGLGLVGGGCGGFGGFFGGGSPFHSYRQLAPPPRMLDRTSFSFPFPSAEMVFFLLPSRTAIRPFPAGNSIDSLLPPPLSPVDTGRAEGLFPLLSLPPGEIGPYVLSPRDGGQSCLLPLIDGSNVFFPLPRSAKLSV